MDIENLHLNLFTTIVSDQINKFLEQVPTLVGAFSLQKD